MDRINPMRRPSIPFVGGGHSSNGSLTTNNRANSSTNSTYASSIYAASTLAASTIFPAQAHVPVHETETQKWAEGHCLQWHPRDDKCRCTICDDKCDEGSYSCSGCGIRAHPRCISQIVLVCPVAFRPDLVRAAFVRCFASLFFSYRKFLHPANGERRKAGLLYHFNMDAFIRSLPSENVEYVKMLRETTAFNEFIHERESKRAENPSIKLFDEIVLSKKNRGKSGFFSKSST